jgi:hypothetical protein
MILQFLKYQSVSVAKHICGGLTVFVIHHQAVYLFHTKCAIITTVR